MSLCSNNQGSWAFIGCVSMEERSICAALAARQLANVSQIAMFRIGDDPNSRFYSESESRTDVNHKPFGNVMESPKKRSCVGNCMNHSGKLPRILKTFSLL